MVLPCAKSIRLAVCERVPECARAPAPVLWAIKGTVVPNQVPQPGKSSQQPVKKRKLGQSVSVTRLARGRTPSERPISHKDVPGHPNSEIGLPSENSSGPKWSGKLVGGHYN